MDFVRQPPPAAQITVSTQTSRLAPAPAPTSNGLENGAYQRENAVRFGWEGWVVTADNQPFGVVNVHIEMALGGNPVMLQTTADSDGYFFLDGSPFRRHPDFKEGSEDYRIMLEGYSSTCMQQWRPPSNPPQQLSIQATGSRRVEVMARLLPEQAQIPGASIHGFLVKEHGFALAKTDANGIAIFHLPEETEWEFMCYAKGLGFGRSKRFDASGSARDLSFDVHPYPNQIQVVAVAEDTEVPLTTARFLSRHFDADVLGYHENLAAIPTQLPAELGELNFELPSASPIYLLIEAEGYQPAAIGIFSPTEKPLKVALAPLKPKSIQVLERGAPMRANVQYEVRARQHRFGRYSHTTDRPGEMFELNTDESGIATLKLPDEIKYYGYDLLITAEDQRALPLTKLQAKDHPSGTWVIEFSGSAVRPPATHSK